MFSANRDAANMTGHYAWLRTLRPVPLNRQKALWHPVSLRQRPMAWTEALGARQPADSLAGLLVEEVQGVPGGGPHQLVDPRHDAPVQVAQPVGKQLALLLIQCIQHLHCRGPGRLLALPAVDAA